MRILEEQGISRVAELLPIRYGRMLASAFTFYRGAAAVMAADLSTTPRTSLKVQLCGDAHLANFGGFASPERTLVFDINDFDETLPGPFEWDVKRLAASFEVAGRDRKFTVADRRTAVLAMVRSYREAMLKFAPMDLLEVWYSRLDVDALAGESQVPARQEEGEGRRAGRGEGAVEGQHAGAGEADASGRRPATDHLRSAAHRADPRAPPGPGGRRAGGDTPRPPPRLSQLLAA